MAGYPGTDGGGSDPLLGGDPVLSGASMGQHFLSQMMGAVTGRQAEALNNGTLEAQAATVIEGMLTALVTDALRQMSSSTQWRPIVDGISDLVKEMGPDGMGAMPGGRSVQSASHDAAALPAADGKDSVQSASPEAPEQPAPAEPKHRGEDRQQGPVDPRAAYREGVEKGKKMTMGSVAKAAAAPLAKRISDSETEWVPGQDEETGKEFWRQIDNRTGKRVHHPEFGFVPDVTEDDEGFADLTRKVRRNTAIRSVATGVLAGEGIAGTLGAAAARVAGPVGIAVGAAKVGATWMESQQAKAEPYKQIYGEDTSTFAAKERFGEWKEGLKGFGTIGAEEARAQYAAASRMGLQGGQRDEATDFMREQQRRFGISTEDSSALVKSALTQGDGTAALEGFANAITQVSRSAVEAGRVSSEAIGQFVAVQAKIATMTPGSGASTQLAAGITDMAFSMPKSLSEALGGAEGIAEGALTQQNVMAMAAISGQSPTAALFNMSDPGAAAEQGAVTIEAVGDLIFQQAANFLGMSEAQFKAALNKGSGGKPRSDTEQFAIIRSIAGPERGGQLLMVLSQITATFLGKPTPQNEIINLLFTIAGGGFQIDLKESAGGDGGSSDHSGPKDSTESVKAATGRGAASSPWGQGATTYMPNLGGVRTDDGGYKPAVGTPMGAGATPSVDEAYSAYQDWVKESGGKGDQTLEALLNPKNRSKILSEGGVSSLDDAVYRVDGKEMTLAEAIKSGKGAQVVDGSLVNQKKPQEQPVDVRVLLDLTPDAKDFVNPGISDDARNGVPSSGNLNPRSVPSYGSP